MPDPVTNAFLTGSRAYGLPSAESDTDIVVLVDGVTMDALLAMTVGTRENPDLREQCSGDESSMSFRFGKLNLIATTNPREFNAWHEGTQQLRTESPVTRGRAVEVLKLLINASRRP
jgi:hypothetical protein